MQQQGPRITPSLQPKQYSTAISSFAQPEWRAELIASVNVTTLRTRRQVHTQEGRYNPAQLLYSLNVGGLCLLYLLRARLPLLRGFLASVRPVRMDLVLSSAQLLYTFGFPSGLEYPPLQK